MVWRIRVPKLNLDLVPKSCKYAVNQVVWRTRIRKVRFPKLISHRGLEAFVDICIHLFHPFFPTCQVRVVRFYVSCLLLLPPPASCLLLVLLVVLLLVVLLVLLVQLRPAIHSVLCRTSTTTIHAQCSLSDLNHDHPRPVFPAGPQPRPSPPSVPCRTSTTTIHAQCSLPDLNREYPRPVFPAGPQPRPSTPSVPCRTSTAYPRQKICHIECQKICQIEC